MFIKIHESYRKVVALADEELIGKKFEEGKKQLDVRESFYKGEEVSFDRAVRMLEDLRSDDATFNIVGEKSVKAALKAGILDEQNIGKVAGIKFALILV